MSADWREIAGWGLFLAVCGFAILSKPQQRDFERELRRQIADVVEQPSAPPGDFVKKLDQLPCSASKEVCFRGYDERIAVRYGDYVVGYIAGVYLGSERVDHCVGVLNSWRCGLPS